MIMVGMLNVRPSSPTKAYGDLAALAKREDLYTGDDFYFGFASSNHTFLDIIGGHQPLAIKYGPVFSIYRHDSTEGYLCETYYIDVKTRELLPIINIMAKPSAASIFNQLLPWSFTDFYLRGLERAVGSALSAEGDDVGLRHGEIVCSIIEQLARGSWPDEHELEQMLAAIHEISSHDDGLTITLADIAKLKQRMQMETAPTANDFVAAYNPFYNNDRLDIACMLEKNPQRITVRQIDGEYPHIQVIIPGVPDDEKYTAVFAKHQLELYQALHVSLAEPEVIQHLLMEHFPEKMSHYFVEHAFDFPDGSAIRANARR